MVITVSLLAAAAAKQPVQWGTLLWSGGAVVAMVVITLAIVVSRRRPQSMEDGMESFHKGLQALAPDLSAQRISGRGRQDSSPSRAPRHMRREPAATTGGPENGD